MLFGSWETLLSGGMGVSEIKRHRLIAAFAISAVLALVAPVGAQAQSAAGPSADPTTAQYGDPGREFGGGGAGDGGPLGGLPLTGLDLAALGVAALALVSGGVALGRLGRTAREPG